MAALVYPKKPWVDGQQAYLMPGMKFAYSLSLKKWVPISPGTSTEEQIEQAFGVRTAVQVEQLFSDITKLQEDMIEYGRIWKTLEKPDESLVNNNDIWIDTIDARLYYWNENFNAWIQITRNQ